ncbi:hypothetical protein HUN41_00088 [Streptomyces phage Coruscant]|uniref:Holliday junction resolvase n=1 Tax=Streptomyces phage Coruscant TaxID=2739834 RepID=A0A7G4AW27_9CAUD|nr:Holliday junction resolvase [Streptomyces phage Coruscant]QMP84217.1 hypothetical protein HUN41_00088 [Streptomyces phage Coruscant]
MSEANEIKRDGGKAQKNSGRGKIQKGDATLGPFCYDIKEFTKSFGLSKNVWGKAKIQKGDATLGPFCYDIKEFTKSFGLSKNVWGKACTDAFRSGRMTPALKIILGEGNEKVRLWVIDETMFKDMLEAWEEKYSE